jgi:dihydrodipicolinate synthase/N-acetylneuraminate lyase
VLIGTSVHMTAGFQNGAVGIVPSGAHLVPDLYQSMYENAMKNNWPEVQRLQNETDAVCQQYIKGKPSARGWRC